MSTEVQSDPHAATDEQSHLLGEFPYPTYEEWYEAAVKLLKGAPFEKKMYTPTYEEITLQPLYTQKDTEGLAHLEVFPGFAPYVRGTHVCGYKIASWEVAQKIARGTPAECNKTLIHALKNGQTTIHLMLDRASRYGVDPDHAPSDDVGRDGVSIATLEDLEHAFDDIDLEQTPIMIRAGVAIIPVTAFLSALLKKRQITLEKVRGCIAMDPLGILVSEGSLPFSLKTAYKKLAALTHWARNHLPHLKTIVVQSAPYHNSGSSAVQELAFVIATAVEYLRAMQNADVSIDDVAPRIQFDFSIGTQYFMEIAKLRAARVVWAKIVKAFGGNDVAQKMTIHGQTALWNKTIHDPYVNMLRTTVETFAGVVGGCDSLHVGCFDEVIRNSDPFSRRIARNTQTILKEETHAGEIIDPAGGAWYVEKLTDDVARRSWTLFQEIERYGGMANALQAGFPQEQIQRTAEKRFANLSTRKDVIVGTNMYPNAGEDLLESHQSASQTFTQLRIDSVANYRLSHSANINATVIEKLSTLFAISPEGLMEATIEAVSAGATLGDIEHALRTKLDSSPTVTPLAARRGAAMFETLRAATEHYTEQTGSRPKIFLANMGPVPQHKARADFSLGFFEVGGFEVLTNPGFLTIDDAANAALESGASAVVICSTDEMYPDLVPPLTRHIKDVNPDMIVILAGYPKDQIEIFKDAGVDEFIHFRANVYSILVNLMKQLGIPTEQP